MTDPTVQSPTGPVPDATGAIAVSLAEIDAMGRKAARGAGYSWGMAEEAGRAARWLAAYGLPGPERLADVLRAVDGTASAHAPSADPSPWVSAHGVMCPVHAGAALSDWADDLIDGREFELGDTLAPILVLPFLCRVARDLEIGVGVMIGSISVSATAVGPTSDRWPALEIQGPSPIIVRREPAPDGSPIEPRSDARTIPVETWRTLDRFARRTYVPATAASREAGAGAGTGDND